VIPPIDIDTAKQHYAIFTADGAESSVLVSIDPTLEISVGTDKESYEWGENITISGNVLKKGKPTEAKVQIKLTCGEWSGYINLDTEGFYTHVYENKFMPPEGDCNLVLVAIAEDSSGNKGASRANAHIAAYTGGTYSVSFEMEKYNYSRGQTIPIKLRVKYTDSPQVGVDVVCSFMGKEIHLAESGGYYQTNYRIPLDTNLGEQSLSCSVISEIPGSGNTKINIEPAKLQITVVNPKILPNDILYVFSDNITVLTVEVRYEETGLPVQDADIQIVYLDTIVNMTNTGNGTYISEEMFFDTETGGITSFVIQAQDPRGNQGDSNITLVVNPGRFNWAWLLLIPAGFVVLFIGWRLYRKSHPEQPRIQIQEKIIRLPVRERVREIVYRPMKIPERPRMNPETKAKNELSGLEERSRTIQNAKDLAEQQYYKRQIDEPTFNKLMQRYEEKLIELDAAISQKKKQISEM
jgi:hypothetical protein